MRHYNADCDCPSCSLTRFIKLAVLDLSVETGDALSHRVTVDIPLVRLAQIRDHIAVLEGYGAMIRQLAMERSEFHSLADTLPKPIGAAFAHKVDKGFAQKVTDATEAMCQALREVEKEYDNTPDKSIILEIAKSLNIKMKG